MPNGNYDNHEIFKKRLIESEKARWVTGFKLSQAGYDVRLPALKVAETRDKWQDNSDNGDIFIEGKGLTEEKIVEAKRLRQRFTGSADWPFGKDFIVCSKNSFDRADPKPWFYVIWSEDWGAFALAYVDDKEHWRVESRTDAELGEEAEYYFTPIHLVKWKKFDKLTWLAKWSDNR
jgi:hypothetical protein